MLEWRSAWRPAQYHGAGRRRNFFEGWYFKLVDATEQQTCAVIPGVFLGPAAGLSYSFVQVFEGRSGRTTFERYPLADFSATPGRFDVRIGPNHFRSEGFTLDVAAAGCQMRGTLAFAGLKPWPVTLLSPGIMGWYAFVPRMECYHGVLSLDHAIEGTLEIDGRTVDFSGGRGYTEKDWGQAFPRAWIWLQSNHFDHAGTSLTASVATIPWLGSAFRGFIVGLWHDGELYRFATYTGAAITELSLTDRDLSWGIEGRAGTGPRHGAYRLEIVTGRAEGGLLHAPSRSDMLPRAVESLTARVTVTLSRLEGGRAETVFAGEGRHAGLEINGELHELVSLEAGRR